MGYAAKVAAALISQGHLTKSTADEMVVRNASIIIAGQVHGDAADDVAHDIFLLDSDSNTQQE